MMGANHLAEDWRFQLSSNDADLLTDSCKSFLTAMLARDPLLRPLMPEAKKMPFLEKICWETLSEETPPPYLFLETATVNAAEKVFPPEPEQQKDVKETEENPVEEEEEEIEEYRAVANAPTISSGKSLIQLPHQLKCVRRFSVPIIENVRLRLREKQRKNIFVQTIGNL